MAFRKRNVAINTGAGDGKQDVANAANSRLLPGTRASPISSHAVTSTGVASLDSFLGGHAGLILGSTVLIEETGTTDYAAALLKFFASEAILQDHLLHVIGVDERWVRELPGVADLKRGEHAPVADAEKMKIAWRYEKMRLSSDRVSANFPPSNQSFPDGRAPDVPFCHTFDLTKRLAIPDKARTNVIRVTAVPNPFQQIVSSLTKVLNLSPQDSVHRIVIPMVLNPAVYHPETSKPEVFLQFIHNLRALTRQHPSRLVTMVSISLELYPRESALVRTAEMLCDGVLALTPFPHLMSSPSASQESSGSRGTDEPPQGIVHIHKLPLITERGEGGAGAGNSIGEDLSFALSRRKFIIKPFALPPLEGDTEAQKDTKKLSADEIAF